MDYPCVGCNEGWGQANPWGVKSCHETCKKYWNWIGEDKKMDKPLKDWTLGEIKAECEKYECCTDGCPAYKFENGCLWRFRSSPNTWDLAEPSRWTEQDKEDAKMIRRVFNGVQIGVARDTLAQLRTIAKDGFPSEYINSDMFHSLKPGEAATLDEIIGGGE